MKSTSGRIARCSHVPSKTWRSWEVLPDQLSSLAQNADDRQVPFGFLDRQDQIQKAKDRGVSHQRISPAFWSDEVSGPLPPMKRLGSFAKLSTARKGARHGG